MPGWLIGIIASLALPVLKQVLKAVLKSLEVKYPGIKPLVDAIIKYLEDGGTAKVVLSHCEAMPGFCPMDLKRDL